MFGVLYACISCNLETWMGGATVYKNKYNQYFFSSQNGFWMISPEVFCPKCRKKKFPNWKDELIFSHSIMA